MVVLHSYLINKRDHNVFLLFFFPWRLQLVSEVGQCPPAAWRGMVPQQQQGEDLLAEQHDGPPVMLWAVVV